MYIHHCLSHFTPYSGVKLGAKQHSSGGQTSSVCAVAWGGVQVSSYYLGIQEYPNVQPRPSWGQPWTQTVTTMPFVCILRDNQ